MISKTVMAFTFNVCFLILVTCQGASYATRTIITAGSGTGSLTDYLHSASQVFSSFTTLVFSPGVHDMCEDSVVVIRDVTNIALIGSETTTTKSVQVGDGEVVDVIEPSTVIDCHGCLTGFVFSNVSELSMYRITLAQCGGYPRSKVPFTSYLAALAILTTKNLTLDTVSFKSTATGCYGLVTVDVLGQSTIRNTFVQQKVSERPHGNILLSYTESYPPNFMNETNTLYIHSMICLYFENKSFALLQNLWPYLSLDISSCHVDLHIILTYVSVHITFDFANIPHRPSREVPIRIMVSNAASRYKIDMQRIRLSGTKQDPITGHALSIIYSAVKLNCPTASSTSIGMITVTDIKVYEYHGVEIDKASIPIENDNYHTILFEQCELPNYMIHALDGLSYFITIRNSTLENRHSNVLNVKSFIHAVNVSHLLIDNCNFLHNWGQSGLLLENGVVQFKGNITFYNNTAEYGGGILMTGSEAVLHLLPHTTLNFIENSALITGGALHIGSRGRGFGLCFIQTNVQLTDIKSNTEQQNIHFFFKENFAGVAGAAIWGGSLDIYCYLNYRSQLPLLTKLATLFEMATNESGLSVISSSPQDMCYCNDTIACTSSPLNHNMYGPSFSLYPGQSLEMKIAIAGQLNGLVPGLVQAELKQTIDINAHLRNLQRTQRVNQAKCTVLEYTIYSPTGTATVQLHLYLAKTLDHESIPLNYDEVNPVPINSEVVSITSSVTLKNCPLGFQHNVSIGSCTCLKALLHYMDNTSCDINTQTVQRTPTLWIIASFTGNNTQILAVHQHCPFDYCDPNKHRLDLSYPHQQCAHSRSGILCGGCRRGLSLTLGSPKCKQCSNRYLSLLLVFPLAGIALVAVLICLNLTVSVGTINGLILYANIIRAIHPVFFPSTNFLSVFVAWMNLDIGMESCLYDGMDFYGLTWLQFVFPVYIWLLVSVMIITSHYSTTAAKLVSRDAVKVLATLFLLSYAKLLRTIITVLSFTYISYEDSDGTTYRSAVWLYDGNVGFVEGKHIPLFLAAIGFGVLYIIPFTLLLLLAPFLQARSHRHRALRWVDKLMPFLDAYQGPYNSRFRFWSGLLLVARVVLFVGFAVNSLGDPQINLKLIVTFLISLFSLQWLLGIAFGSASLYNEWFINVLEAFYLCNLGVLSTWSLLQADSNTSSRKVETIITSVCVGLAFLVWVCILAYHAYLWLTQVEYVTRLWQTIKGKGHPADDTSDPISPQAAVQQHNAVVQRTYIELRESLLTDH